jgi:hypothetical protein
MLLTKLIKSFALRSSHCTVFFLLTCLSTLGISAAQSEPVNSLVLKVNSNVISTKSLVSLHVTILDLLGKPLKFVRTAGAAQAPGGYVVRVTYYSTGREKSVEYNQMIRDHEPTAYSSTNIIVSLAPGEQFDEDLELRTDYELRKPGRYMVRVSKDVSVDGKIMHIESNSVTFTVRP